MTLHWTLRRRVVADRRKEEDIALPLMIPLMMKMLYILRQRMAERRFPTQNQSCETLFFD
jgi:hypothetical protein